MQVNAVAGRRVLVVEDDYFIAKELAQTLSETGAEIIGPVPSARDALQALGARPDVATLDVELRDGTSLPVADELATRGIPFVFVTGSADALPAEHRSRPICHKPVCRLDLMRALSVVLREPPQSGPT